MDKQLYKPVEKQIFLKSFFELLEIEDSPTSESEALAQPLPLWDSLAVLSTIAMADEHFQVMLPGKDLESCKTVGDVWALIDRCQIKVIH